MLPFLRKQLYLANAANYPGKREYFYPLKNKLIRKYGKYDGYDVQRINKTCWHCGGSGIDPYDEDDSCHKCDGTGIYDTKIVYLERYLIKGDNYVYHSPRDNWVTPKGEKKSVIEGLVKHEPIPEKLGIRACKLLMWRHQPFKLLTLEICLLVKRTTYRWHSVYFPARSFQSKLIISFLALFAGWFPTDWYSDEIAVSKPASERDKAILHLKWVLRAWENNKNYGVFRLACNPWQRPLIFLALLFVGGVLHYFDEKCTFFEYHIDENDPEYKCPNRYTAPVHLEWIIQAYANTN